MQTALGSCLRQPLQLTRGVLKHLLARDAERLLTERTDTLGRDA
jgi:hypothetical protein